MTHFLLASLLHSFVANVFSVRIVGVGDYNYEPKHVYTFPRFQKSETLEYTRMLGDKVTLHCDAIGGPKNIIEWTRNGASISEREYISKVKRPNSFVLQINYLEVIDQGVWSCKVSNPAGSISRNFTIDIVDLCEYFFDIPFSSYPLECVCVWFFTVRPPHKSIDYSSLEASAEQCKPFSLKIHRARLAIEDAKRMKALDDEKRMLNAETSTAEPTSLQVTNNASIEATLTQSANQTAIQVSNTTTASPVPATFFRPPQFATPNASTAFVVPAGRTVRFNCKITNFANHTIRWYKFDNLLEKSTPRAAGSFHGVRSQVLEFEDAVPSDSGNYTCVVGSDFGDSERLFHLQVLPRLRSKPIFGQNILRDQKVPESSTVDFRCEMMSDLAPFFVWAKISNDTDRKIASEKLLEDEAMRRYEKLLQDPRVRVIASNNVSTLSISNVSIPDEGEYACVAGNFVGISIISATLQIIRGQRSDLAHYDADDVNEYATTILICIALLLFLLTLVCCLLIGFIFAKRYRSHKRESKHKALSRVSLPPKRKKVVVRQKDLEHVKTGWSDLPSTYQIHIIEQQHSNGELTMTRDSQISSSDPTLNCEYEIEEDPAWEIDRSRIELVDILGAGAFGQVWRGHLLVTEEDFPQSFTKTPFTFKQPIAVKKLKDRAHERELRDLVLEMTILKTLEQIDYAEGKENVLRLLGCCTGVAPLLVVLELCDHGNLRDFLRVHRPNDDAYSPPPSPTGLYDFHYGHIHRKPQRLIEKLSTEHLTNFAYQVSNGMNYLSQKQIVHRDLAARNILVADKFVLKVSDFGLSRSTTGEDYYRKKNNGRLPYKWMAPEALDFQVYTTETDVWSYGILLWEIFTLGGAPYPNVQISTLLSMIKEGFRMQMPDGCPKEVYGIMLACWKLNKEERPSFQLIRDYLEYILEDMHCYGPFTSSNDDDENDKNDKKDDDDAEHECNSSNSEATESSISSADRKSKKKRKTWKRQFSAPNIKQPEEHIYADLNEINDIEADVTEHSQLLAPTPPPPRQPSQRKASKCSTTSKRGVVPQLSLDLSKPSTSTIKRSEGPSSAPPESDYSVPNNWIVGMKVPEAHEYVNITVQKNGKRAKKPKNALYAEYMPHHDYVNIKSRPSSTRHSDTAATRSVCEPRRYSNDSRASSGRGGSSGVSSEGLGGLADIVQIQLLPPSTSSETAESVRVIRNPVPSLVSINTSLPQVSSKSTRTNSPIAKNAIDIG